MKQKLIKQFENGTDFSVCVIAMENGTYVVTEYDFVNKKHELKGKYNDKNQALIAAKEINKSFMEPSKQTIKLKESQLRNIIKESINQILNEENEETFESVVFKKAFDIRAWVRDIQHAMSGLEQCARQMDAKEGATAHYLTQVVNGVRFSLEQIENAAIELKNARADVIRQQK